MVFKQMQELTDEDREYIESFAEACYHHFEKGKKEGKFDSRSINSIVVDVVNQLMEPDVRPWHFTTTRYNERIIRTKHGDVMELTSYEMPLRERAYEVSGFPKDEFEDVMFRFVLSRIEHVYELEQNAIDDLLG